MEHVEDEKTARLGIFNFVSVYIALDWRD